MSELSKNGRSYVQFVTKGDKLREMWQMKKKFKTFKHS
jgi:hypothetical protein